MEMRAAALVKLLELLEGAGIPSWLDGGWGVDALLEQQTRPHKDLDLILAVSGAPKLQELLAPRGFLVTEGSPPDAFVLADGEGLSVDIHAVRWDSQGNGIYRMENGQDWVYPADGFSGRGAVDGYAVRCLTPEVQVLCHAHGYTPVEQDLKDMAHLERRFGVELPPHLCG